MILIQKQKYTGGIKSNDLLDTSSTRLAYQLPQKIYKDLKNLWINAMVKRRIATTDYPYSEARYYNIWEYIRDINTKTKV